MSAVKLLGVSDFGHRTFSLTPEFFTCAISPSRPYTLNSLARGHPDRSRPQLTPPAADQHGLTRISARHFIRADPRQSAAR